MSGEQDFDPDVTNPIEIAFEDIKPAYFANVYEILELPNGMIQITFGHYIGENSIVSHPTGIILTRKDAASIGASILSLTGVKDA